MKKFDEMWITYSRPNKTSLCKMQIEAIKSEEPLDSENTCHCHINKKIKYEEWRFTHLSQEQTS